MQGFRVGFFCWKYRFISFFWNNRVFFRKKQTCRQLGLGFARGFFKKKGSFVGDRELVFLMWDSTNSRSFRSKAGFGEVFIFV